MRCALCLMLLLAGCSARSNGVPAAPFAADCARDLVATLGYSIWGDGGAAPTSFVAQKSLPRDPRGPVLGEISVAVLGDDDGDRRLLVEGRRYLVERGGAVQRLPTPTPGQVPRAGGAPGEPQRTAVRIGGGGAGRRSIPAGVAGEDADLVREQCGAPGQPLVASRGDRAGLTRNRTSSQAGGVRRLLWTR